MIFIVHCPMELFQILHKNIPQKKKIFVLFSRKKTQDVSKFLLQTIKNIVKDTKDKKILNGFFIEFYDMIYYYIVFKKIKIAKKILRLLEELTLSISYVGDEKWKETVKKIKKIRL